MTKSLNDEAWEKLFERYGILQEIASQGCARILAKQIKDFREPRLMTKFDHASHLPRLFAENKLSILPTSRGGYVIGPFETFHNLRGDDAEVLPMGFPSFVESLDYRAITSEATAINCAFISGILGRFTGEGELLPTVSGRMSSSAFSFSVNTHGSGQPFRVAVENAQLEIDGGYEGSGALYLIEAKHGIPTDFVIRQLYYPYRLWRSKIRKSVRPVFLTYCNGVFHLREYAFTSEQHYNSLVLVTQQQYTLQQEGLSTEAVVRILNETAVVPEPRLPFPQADSFDRVINLCELLAETAFLSREEITRNYDFDVRQTGYYASAAMYLGLADIGGDPTTGERGCFLTSRGRQVFSLGLEQRQRAFVGLIVSHPAFRETLVLYLTEGRMPARETVVEIMRRSGLYRVGRDSTYFRRASTVMSWVRWIIDQTES